MNHHLLFRGVGFSFLLHGTVLFFIACVGNLLPEVTPPLTIDFSIESDSTVYFSGDNSHKLPESAHERESSELPAKKADPANTSRLMETKSEPITPKQAEPEPEPVKAEAQNPVPKKLVPLQTKKWRVVEEKAQAAAVAQFAESPPFQIQPEEIEPAVVGGAEKVLSPPEEVSAETPGAAPVSQIQSPSLKEQYIEINWSEIRDAVERETRYPDMARRMGWEGRVLIAFTVRPDGLAEDIRVVKSCGFKGLDNNAIDTIKRCAPFPKPPVRAELTLPIVYKLN